MPDPSTSPLKEPCERIIDPLNPLTWWQTARRIAADKPDVLLLQWWTPFWLPLLLTVSVIARRARIPILYLCHQMIEPDSSALELLLARPALRLGDAFIVVSKKDFVMTQRIIGDKPIRMGHLPLYDSFPQQGLTRVEARTVSLAAEGNRLTTTATLGVRVNLFDGYASTAAREKAVQNRSIVAR